MVNTRGGKGKNVPVDLAMEHLNRTVKSYISSLGANVSESSILQCGRSLNGIMDVCTKFDNENGIKPESIEHTRTSTSSDRDKIVKELIESKVFNYVPGRYHHSFKGIQPSISSVVNKGKLINWIQEQKKKLIANITLSKLYGH